MFPTIVYCFQFLNIKFNNNIYPTGWKLPMTNLPRPQMSPRVSLLVFMVTKSEKKWRTTGGVKVGRLAISRFNNLPIFWSISYCYHSRASRPLDVLSESLLHKGCNGRKKVRRNVGRQQFNIGRAMFQASDSKGWQRSQKGPKYFSCVASRVGNSCARIFICIFRLTLVFKPSVLYLFHHLLAVHHPIEKKCWYSTVN